jgi:hypothetical protein
VKLSERIRRSHYYFPSWWADDAAVLEEVIEMKDEALRMKQEAYDTLNARTQELEKVVALMMADHLHLAGR